MDLESVADRLFLSLFVSLLAPSVGWVRHTEAVGGEPKAIVRHRRKQRPPVVGWRRHKL
jgi:hypothetical protein